MAANRSGPSLVQFQKRLLRCLETEDIFGNENRTLLATRSRRSSATGVDVNSSLGYTADNPSQNYEIQ
jgi:hypothetical protein